jgi:hypothetical protein
MFQRLAVLAAVLGLALGQPLAFAEEKAPPKSAESVKPAQAKPDAKPIDPKQAVGDAQGGLTAGQWGLIAGATAMTVGVAVHNRASLSTSGTH